MGLMLPDWSVLSAIDGLMRAVFRAGQAVSRRMLEHYSHIRIAANRQTLDALDAGRRAPGSNGNENGQDDSEIEAVVEAPDGLMSQSR